MSAYDRMLENAPPHLSLSNYFKDLMLADGLELDTATTSSLTLANQLIVTLADYGLSLWEEFLGLQVNPESRSTQERRERILSKLRGSGTTTKDMILAITKSFANGEVLITEQSSLYQFTVSFISEIGIPAQINDLKAAIEEAKPAHLAVVYAYLFITFGQLAVKTHSQLAAFTHDRLRNDGSVIT